VAGWAQVLWERDAASQALGMELLSAGGGSSTVRMLVREDMVQGHGTAHGGILFTLGDTAFAFSCNGPDQVVVGASADITWVAGAAAGDVLIARGEQKSRYGRSGVTRVEIEREADGRLIALFQGRSRDITRASPPGRT